MTDTKQYSQVQIVEQSINSNGPNNDQGISKYRGICCKSKYEYEWLKNETCCFCCGIRCALLGLFIFMMLDGIEEIMMSLFFYLNQHRSIFGVIINALFGVSSILVGVVGYIGILKSSEKLVRITYYVCLAGLPASVAIFTFAIIESVINKIYWLVPVMIVDMILAISLWIYVTYKVKKYHELVFSHYQQLSDGIKEEQQQQRKKSTSVDI